MKTVIQRVSSASVEINKIQVAKINSGLLILIGIEDADHQENHQSSNFWR
jgi:D-aminoacyl-tRNA deacylase